MRKISLYCEPALRFVAAGVLLAKLRHVGWVQEAGNDTSIIESCVTLRLGVQRLRHREVHGSVPCKSMYFALLL